MMFYTKLNFNQNNAAYALFRTLEKLRIIGHIQVHTEQVESDSGDLFSASPHVHFFVRENYNLIKDKYTSTFRELDAIEQVERALNTKFKWTV